MRLYLQRPKSCMLSSQFYRTKILTLKKQERNNFELLCWGIYKNTMYGQENKNTSISLKKTNLAFLLEAQVSKLK